MFRMAKEIALSANKREELWSTIALVLGGMATLFIELTLIRYLPGQIRVLGYFTNFVLFSAFLGFGLGMLAAGRWPKLAHVSWGAPFALLLVVAIAGWAQTLQVRAGPEDFLFLEYQTAGTPILLLPFLVISFLTLAASFVPLGHFVGVTLAGNQPLRRYGWNLVGSLLGIGAFVVLNGSSAPPWLWLLLAGAFSCVAVWNAPRPLVWAAMGSAALTVVVAAYCTSGATWSPYQKITTAPIHVHEKAGLIQEWRIWELTPEAQKAVAHLPREEGFTVRVNDDSYQHPVDLSDKAIAKHPALAPFRLQYDLPFKLKKNVGRVLIMGAGTGNDVAGALRCGATHVDAVEIDPAILKLGQEHPEHPYSDPRVTVHLMDARQFLARTKNKYDMVVFGLLDSHVLLSHMSNVRMDSFVFTKESFELARQHLADDGLMVVSHAVGTDWFRERMLATITAAYDKPPLLLNDEFNQPIGYAYAIGPQSRPGRAALPDTTILSDDWPFVYLREARIPVQYWMAMAVIAIASLVSVRLVSGGQWQGIDPHFFALGAGFLLLETRGLGVIALNLGSTWSVNSAVFAGVIGMALIANILAARFPQLRSAAATNVSFVLLGLLLAGNYLLPMSTFAGLDPLPRMSLSVLCLCLPLFASGLVFSASLARCGGAQGAIASNLLGAMAGGLLEYVSMVSGFRNLLLLAAVFYVLAFIVRPRIMAAMERHEEEDDAEKALPAENRREELLEPVASH
jgi:hypothetical protein